MPSHAPYYIWVSIAFIWSRRQKETQNGNPINISNIHAYSTSYCKRIIFGSHVRESEIRLAANVVRSLAHCRLTRRILHIYVNGHGSPHCNHLRYLKAHTAPQWYPDSFSASYGRYHRNKRRGCWSVRIFGHWRDHPGHQIRHGWGALFSWISVHFRLCFIHSFRSRYNQKIYISTFLRSDCSRGLDRVLHFIMKTCPTHRPVYPCGTM